MKRTLCLVGMMVFFVLCATSSWAEKAYVTDRFKVTFRSGPSLENKVIRMLPSGQELEVLDTEGDWSHVRVIGAGDEDVDGWILSRFLIERLPWEKKAKMLEARNQELEAKLAMIDEKRKATSTENQQLSGELRKTQASLQDLKKKYENLKKGASRYLALKNQYTTMKSTLERNQKKLAALTSENDKLRSSERRRWFITGALVLLCGWIIGLVMGRTRRRRRSIYD
ncbi:MAG: TIGR04211 family SH3 domain-containing protein [Deltaproteobacteria bacterium]|nr:TIGR04211 family SH3 domain-containing protein [Deltaproteobacteria bacterium]